MQPDTPDIPFDPNLGFEETEQPTSWFRFWIWFILFDFLILTPIFVIGGAWYVLNQPPADFSPQTVTIPLGASVPEIADIMHTNNIVRSGFLLEMTLRFAEDATKIQAGNYQFTEAQTIIQVAEHLVSGDLLHELVSLTLIEGLPAHDYAATAAELLPNVSQAEFISLTADLEGKLFPETYFVPGDFSTTELVDLLMETHTQTIDVLQPQFASQNLTSDEAVTLASIVEREANTPESMRTVAGIFLNRLSIGMALQADASIEYVLDTPLGDLPPGQLATELRELDSPYNTYLYPGLPPTPIGNPGATALQAVADPIQSEYLFYITGNDGNFYYAESFAEHQQNITRHLR